MKLETILNAMILAYAREDRQYHAFRDRILKIDAEKDDKIAFLGNANMIFSDKFKEKNREIKRLTDTNDAIYRQLIKLQERNNFNLEDWGG